MDIFIHLLFKEFIIDVLLILEQLVMRLMFLEMKKKMVMLEIKRLRTTWCYLVF